jgi:hypothetical protein
MRQYTPLKHWPTPMRLHSTIYQKALIFLLTAVRTRNLTRWKFTIAKVQLFAGGSESFLKFLELVISSYTFN